MNSFSHTNARFRYQVETTPLADGARAWSVFHEQRDGRRTVLATGTLVPNTGDSFDHDDLVSFIRIAEDRRSVVS